MSKWRITCYEKRSWRNLWRGRTWTVTHNNINDFAHVHEMAKMCEKVFDCVTVEGIDEA